MQLPTTAQGFAAELNAELIDSRRHWRLACIAFAILSFSSIWMYQFKSPETIYMDRWFVKDEQTGLMTQYALMKDMPLENGDSKILGDVMNYVIFREYYNFFPIQWAADRTFAMSSPSVAEEYKIEALENTAKHGINVTATVHIESVIQRNDWTVEVRFTKTVVGRTGSESTTNEIAIVTFEYQDVKKLEIGQKMENLPGFQVTSYLVSPQDLQR